jgi:hypothetical protein
MQNKPKYSMKKATTFFKEKDNDYVSMFKIAGYCAAIAFLTCRCYDMAHISAITAKGAIAQFSDTK